MAGLNETQLGEVTRIVEQQAVQVATALRAETARAVQVVQDHVTQLQTSTV